MTASRRIEHFGGTLEMDEETPLEEVLSVRDRSGANEFWIFRGSEYPHLAILVNGDRTCLHYFPEEGHPGFRSRGQLDGPDGEQHVVFYANAPREELTVPAKACAPFDLAMRVARAFLADPQLPPALRWDEL